MENRLQRSLVLNDSGFSLVEAVVGFSILIVGMLAVGLMLMTSMQTDTYNTRMRFAQEAAKAKMEEIRSSGAGSFSPQSGTEIFVRPTGWVSPTGGESSWATRTWQITADAQSGLNRIQVNVNWSRYKFGQVSYGK
ncbi:MAG TPA: hypothetical protein VK463_18995 [Desulfomonilaceae bacterium]|nr:hypothetical protein [Desulfomonilaceae bacterium]